MTVTWDPPSLEGKKVEILTATVGSIVFIPDVRVARASIAQFAVTSTTPYNRPSSGRGPVIF